MIKLEYRNIKCKCCGIPQVSSKYFMRADNVPVQVTSDHVLLKSLGGTEVVPMCYDCNHKRANLFAELSEYLDWYKSGEPLPKKKNFSYLKNLVNIKKPMPVLPSKNISVPVCELLLNGFKYKKYVHPLFGESLVKIED